MSNYTKFFAEIPIAAKVVDFVLPIIEQMLNGDRESAFDFPEHDLFKHERLYSVLYNATSEWFDEVPDPMDRLRAPRTTIKRNEDGGVVITVRAAINYECGIINHFHDWICAFIDLPHGEEYAYFKLEDYYYENSPIFVGLPISVRWMADCGWSGQVRFSREYYTDNYTVTEVK
jgi:hypothetical protein